MTGERDAGAAADGPWQVRVELPVAWGDMDAFGHVNNTMYLRWFEDARIAWFRAAGVMDRPAASSRSPEAGQPAPILASTSCQFLRPVGYPDTVTAEARTTRVGRSSFTMAYRIHSERLGCVVAEGEGVVVMVDYGTGRSVAISPALRARMEAVDAG